MIQLKYLLIVGIIICILLFYYTYQQLHTVKANYYLIAHKINDLEDTLAKNKCSVSPVNGSKLTHSPPMSVSYYSDMVGSGGNLSVKYADLSESEAKRLMQKIENKPKVTTNKPKYRRILNELTTAHFNPEVQLSKTIIKSISESANKQNITDSISDIPVNASKKSPHQLL